MDPLQPLSMQSSTPWESLLIQFPFYPKKSSKPLRRVRLREQIAYPRSFLVERSHSWQRETRNLLHRERFASNHSGLPDGKTLGCAARGLESDRHKGGLRRRRVRLVFHLAGRRAGE